MTGDMKTNPAIRGTTPEVRANAKALRANLTPAERRLWEALRGRRLSGLRFRCQHPVGPFILDFWCPERKLAVEVDGDVHDNPDQAAYDTFRTEQLNAFGYRVVRVRNDEVFHDLSGVLARIAAACASLPETGPHPSPSPSSESGPHRALPARMPPTLPSPQIWGEGWREGGEARRGARAETKTRAESDEG